MPKKQDLQTAIEKADVRLYKLDGAHELCLYNHDHQMCHKIWKIMQYFREARAQAMTQLYDNSDRDLQYRYELINDLADVDSNLFDWRWEMQELERILS